MMPGKRPAPQPPASGAGAGEGKRVTRSTATTTLKRSASSAALAPSCDRQTQSQPHAPSTPQRQFTRQNTDPNLGSGQRAAASPWKSTTKPAPNPNTGGGAQFKSTAGGTANNPPIAAPTTPPRNAGSATPRPVTPSRIPVPAGLNPAAARLKKLQEFARIDATIRQQQQPQSPKLKLTPAASSIVIPPKGATPPKKRKAEDAQATYVKEPAQNDETSSSKSGAHVNPPARHNSKPASSTGAGAHLPWVELHAPENSSTGHFVNPRKVAEVKNWLLLGNPELPRVLLLVGPSGSGKTATICTLAKENGFLVREWVNPVDIFESPWDADSDTYRPEEREIWFTGRRQSQVEQFAEFLLRASTYNILPSRRTDEKTPECTDPLVMVEDLPNTFYKKPEVLHDIIRNYCKYGGSPLVFIIPESTSSATGQHRLFPPALMAEIGVTQIPFNKVAPTFIVAYLTGICAREKLTVDKTLLEEIALTSNGDMRWAMNNLEFRLYGTKDDFKKPLLIPPAKKRKGETLKAKKAAAAAKNAAGDNDYLKDESIFLFHALGKVLYAKRDGTVQNLVEDKLIGSTMEWARRPNPLLENPDTIGERVQVSPQTFFNFLGHNYLSFFTNMEEAARASEHLADAAQILSHWTADDSGKVNEMREEMGLSIAIRGLMHVNGERPSSSFKPLRKPLFTESNPQLMKTIQSVQTLFGNRGPVCQDFYAHELPFYRKVNASRFDSAQQKLIKQVGMMELSKQLQRRSALLTDNDAAVDDVDVLPRFADVELDDSQKNRHVVEVESQSEGFVVQEDKLVKPTAPDDEYVIEDYDSEPEPDPQPKRKLFAYVN